MTVAGARIILRRVATVQSLINEVGLQAKPQVDVCSLYDILVTDESLRKATRQLFTDKHYAQAVEEGYKCLNNVVKRRSGLGSDGANLMRMAFSPENPRLKINELQTPSHKDEQRGYMEIMAGCMTGIRNPRAHEDGYVDDPCRALEMLIWANHLIRIVKASRRTRRK